MLIALVLISEQNSSFERDFIDRILQVGDQLTDRSIEQFTSED